MERSENIDLSIIIVTYNSLPSLADSLKSIKSSTGSMNYEVVMVDNYSTDDSIITAQNIISDINILKNDHNAGFAKACNQAAEASRGNYLLYFNPDLEIDPGAISIMLDFIRSHESAGAVGGRMRNSDDSFQPTCRKFPTVKNILFSRGSLLSKLFSENEVYTLPDYTEDTNVEAVAGTLLMVRKDVFDKIGMFDERFFMYIEDTDLCFRLAQAGYTNYFLPGAGGVHLWGKGSSGGQFLRNRFHHRSVLKYFKKHKSGFFSTIILPILLGFNLFLKTILSINNND